MSKQHTERNRLRLQLDKTIRELNRSIINPGIQELKLDDLKPILKLVAHARSAYLNEIMDISKISGDELPSPAQVSQLAKHREVYEELLAASRAMDAAIERGYLDVISD